MVRIKGWKKIYEQNYALGKTEEWKSRNTNRRIELKGVIGRYGSKAHALDITGFDTLISSDRASLKRRAVKYMKAHPRG